MKFTRGITNGIGPAALVNAMRTAVRLGAVLGFIGVFAAFYESTRVLGVGLTLVSVAVAAWGWPGRAAKRSPLHRVGWTGRDRVRAGNDNLPAGLFLGGEALALLWWLTGGPFLALLLPPVVAAAVWWQRRGWPVVVDRNGLHIASRPPEDAVLVGMTAPLTPMEPRRPVYSTLPHVFYSAPSGTGKSRTLMAALLEWPHQAIVLDPKGEFWKAVACERASLTGRPARLWRVDAEADPIGIAGLVGGLSAAMQELQRAIDFDPHYAARSAAFTVPGTQALAAFALDAQARGRPPFQTAVSVGDWAEELRRIASESPSAEARHQAQQALRAATSPNYWGSIQGNLGRYLPTMAAMARALDGPPPTPDEDVYIYLPAYASQGGGPSAVMARWLLQAVWRWKARAEAEGRSWPTLMAADEALALSTPALQEMGRLGRSAGIRLWIVVQDPIAANRDPNLARLSEIMGGVDALFPTASPDDPAWKGVWGLLPPLTPKGEPKMRRAVATTMASWGLGVLWAKGAAIPLEPAHPPEPRCTWPLKGTAPEVPDQVPPFQAGTQEQDFLLD